MNKSLLATLTLLAQSSVILTAQGSDKDNEMVYLSGSESSCESVTLAGSGASSGSSASSGLDVVNLDTEDSASQDLSPKQRMEKYLKAWHKGVGAAIPIDLFEEVYKSPDMNSLEKVGLSFFQSRLLPSYKVEPHKVAHYLERGFTDFHKICYGEVTFMAAISSLVGGVAGGVGGLIVSLSSGNPAVGFGVCVPLGFTLGGNIGGCINYNMQKGQWAVSAAPIPLNNTTIGWISKNKTGHHDLYQKKITDALYTDFQGLEPNVFTLLKTALLDINGALPVTSLTQELPEDSRLSCFIDPQDIRKFKIMEEEGDRWIELYAYGKESIDHTENVVAYLQSQPADVIRSTYKIFTSVAEHKNFYAYTDSQNQTFAYTEPKMVGRIS